MNKLIINADDCGKSKGVNNAIKEAIMAGMISSTTVMANMDDLDGAVELYHQWNKSISFGIHLNITEGMPLLPSQVFLDTGFCIEEEGKMVFNKLAYLYKYPNKQLAVAIYRELAAQIKKIEDSGIRISHIDSHRHMHLAPFILPIVCEVAKDHGISKIRRARNRVGYSLRGIKEHTLNVLRGFYMNSFIQTDVFCSVDEYTKVKKADGKIYELMCHPGHSNPKYKQEMKNLERNISNILVEDTLMNYIDLQ